MLHRSMAEYVHKSPDNQARMLLAYFSGMMVRQFGAVLSLMFRSLVPLPWEKSGRALLKLCFW